MGEQEQLMVVVLNQTLVWKEMGTVTTTTNVKVVWYVELTTVVVLHSLLTGIVVWLHYQVSILISLIRNHLILIYLSVNHTKGFLISLI